MPLGTVTHGFQHLRPGVSGVTPDVGVGMYNFRVLLFPPRNDVDETNFLCLLAPLFEVRAHPFHASNLCTVP